VQHTAEIAGLWDQSTLDSKLGKIQTLARHQMQLLSKVGALVPAAAGGGGHEIDLRSDLAFAKIDSRCSNMSSPGHLQRPLDAHFTVLDQLDAAAAEAHRCVVEMRQRIEELAKIHQIMMPASTVGHLDGTLARAYSVETAKLHQVDVLAHQTPRQRHVAVDPTLPPQVPRLDVLPLRASPLKNRVVSARSTAANNRVSTLWDGVPQLHPCFVAIADGEWSHLLTVEHLKKEDIRTKCVSLTSFTAFLRHCKAYIKLGFAQNASEQAFKKALRSSGCAYDDHRVNFYGFCQV
jgi:hypothetical protein